MGQANKKKQIIAKYKEVSAIIGKEKEKIAEISPLQNYLKKEGKDKQDKSKFTDLFNSEVFQRKYGVKCDRVNPTAFNKSFIDALTKLLNTDYAVEKLGLKNALENREQAFIDFTYNCLGFNTEVMVKIIEEITNLGFLSRITQYRIRQRLYYECDDLYNDAGRKLAELCFNEIEYIDIKEMLLIEMEKRASSKSENLSEHMDFEDATKLDKAIKKGEPFTIYRGFLIDPLEMVRGEGNRIDNENVEIDYLGRKADGDEYFKKWNAGKGLSFTFNENIAGWFCYWQLTFGEKSTYGTKDDKRDIWSNMNAFAPDITTKEEYIAYFGDTYQKRLDALGKKAIVCKLIIDPKDIKGFSFGKSEAELNVFPQDAKVVHYEICGGNKIAEKCWETNLCRATETQDISYAYSATKVSILNYQDSDGNAYQIFADKAEIEEEIGKMKDAYYENGSSIKIMDMMQVSELFKDAAIELPREYNPKKLTKDFWDFLLRRPERKLRKKGMVYIVS